MTYLVTGAAGQLGSTFMRRLRAGPAVTGVTRAELDLTDHQAVLDTVARVRPDVIVNCAAYNAVDQAEDDVRAALAVNAFGVQSLASAAGQVDATLVHYSTDFVFDGTASAPYVEDAPANPASVYGQSKLVGEWMALQ
ncbi:MAG TPA: sugar nucleotide-binding protein, partial [Methylomirabilota bacterium]